MRSSQENRARRNRRGQKMISFPELDTDAVARGWEKAAPWYNFCPAFNNISGGAQISQHRDLLGPPQFISQPGLGLGSREGRFTTPAESKRSFIYTDQTESFCCAPTMPSL